MPLPHVRGQLIKRMNVALNMVNQTVWNNAPIIDKRMAMARLSYTMEALAIIESRGKFRDFAMAISEDHSPFYIAIPEFDNKYDAYLWALSIPLSHPIKAYLINHLKESVKEVRKLYVRNKLGNPELSNKLDQLTRFIVAVQTYESGFNKAMVGAAQYIISEPVSWEEYEKYKKNKNK